MFVLFFYNEIIYYDKQIFETLIYNFIPSLLPSLLLINLFIYVDGITYLYMLLKKNTLGKILFYFLILILIFSLGLPGNITIINDLKKKKIINDSNHLLSSLGCVSFPYAYGICLTNISNKIVAITILFIYIIINLISLLIFNFKINFDHELKITNTLLSESFEKAYINSFKTILLIIVSSILFSSFLFIFNNFNSPLNYTLNGFIEFSYSCYNLSLLNTTYSYINVLFFLLFPSLSIYFQIKMIDKSIKVIPLLVTRLLISLSSICIFIIFLHFYHM